MNPAERGAAGHQRNICAAQAAGNRIGLRSAETNDADAASSGRRGYGDDRVGCRKHPGLTARDSSRYLRNEMRTVLENASPMLSVVTPGTSATAMCTSRRSYGLSG